MAKELKGFKNQILKRIQDGLQIVMGGDNCVTFSSLLTALDRISDTKSIGYIQFDSHGEINKLSESPTGNFHGMYMRPFFEKFNIPNIESLVKRKIKSENAIFIGNLDLDFGERKFFNKKRFKVIGKEGVNTSIKKFAKFVKSLDYLHINFDVDIFDKSVSPATGIPTKGGFFWKDIEPFLKIISKHPDISFDLCKVNSKKRGGEKTIKLAQKVILTMLYL